MLDKNDYTPKFRIGETVSYRPFASDARTGVIASRKVTRRNDRCDTVYTLDNGDIVWEWNAEPTSCLLKPGEWADRLTSRTWHGRAWGFALTVSMEHRHVEMTIDGPKGSAYISAPLTENGEVEAIGWHNVNITVNGETTVEGHDNLGSALVAVSNGLR